MDIRDFVQTNIYCIQSLLCFPFYSTPHFLLSFFPPLFFPLFVVYLFDQISKNWLWDVVNFKRTSDTLPGMLNTTVTSCTFLYWSAYTVTCVHRKHVRLLSIFCLQCEIVVSWIIVYNLLWKFCFYFDLVIILFLLFHLDLREYQGRFVE